jgi:HTH-type transcriptional regulator, transcriptional repressor of NAD biosynthesis genes
MDRPPDYLFASEPYGLELAQVLGARYVPVDPRRERVPISATAIRADPMRCWDYLLPEARPYFLRRVAIVGPESSGKSTLTAALAAHYDTRYVAEYGRTYLDAMGLEINAEAILNIVRGHRAAEEAMARQCRRLLFTDTESIVTRLWSQILLGHVPDLVEQYVREERYDLYLVTAATEKWVEDPQRFQPEASARREFAARCIEVLESLGRPYVLLHGDWEERQLQAVTAVEALLR